MARPREFIEEEALHAVMIAFWRNGYDGTSVPDLLKATGLSRSSLYGALGDKAGLFRAAAGLYVRMHGEPRIAALRGSRSPILGLRQFFTMQIDGCVGGIDPPGCFITNTAISMETLEPQVRDFVGEVIAGLRGHLRQAVVDGLGRDEFRADCDPDKAADMLLAVSMGINVLARVSADRQRLRAMSDTALRALA